MPNNEYSATEQPDPIHNDRPACWDLVMKDMQDRDTWGRSKYGTPLQPFNNRNALVDFYQEVLDATVYCRQKIEEDKVLITQLEQALSDLERFLDGERGTVLDNAYDLVKSVVVAMKSR
jgi:hypothetical protein